jgi:hypothetical protein
MAMRKISGRTSEEMYGRGLSPMTKSEERKYYPTVSIPLDAIPEAKNWKPGETYDVTLRLKMTGLSLRRYGDSKDTGESSYEIHGVDAPGTPVKGAKRESVTSRYVEESRAVDH